MADITVTTNDVRLGGWTSVSVRRSLEQFCDDFSLEVSNLRVNGSGAASSTGVDRAQVRTMADELRTGDQVVIKVDEQTVLTGYVDTFNFEHDAQRSSLRISGRSKNGDLIDSSAIHRTGVWKKASLQEIARDLCLPFAVLVVDHDNLSGKAFERFRLDASETVHGAIARAAEMRSCLLTCNVHGDVEIVRASAEPARATLEMGVNILRASATRATQDRFSAYSFRGQTSASDSWSGKKAAQLQGEVEDPDVGRHRPKRVLRGKQKSGDDLGARAVWERNVRAGRSLRYSCTVLDWTDQEGRLWEPNTMVRVRDPWAEVDADLLLINVEHTLSGTERMTSLELMDRVAFDPEPRAFVKRVKRLEPPPSSASWGPWTGPTFGVGR